MLIISMPYLAPDDLGGGGDTGGTGSPNAGGTSGFNPGGGGGTPSIVDLTPDHMVRIAGQKDPIKFSDYKRDHISQSEYTKKTQAHAANVKAWEAEKQAATQKLLDYAKKIRGGEQGSTPQADPLAELRKQSFIDGNAAASIVETIQTKGIGPIVQAIQKRDEALKVMYGQIEKMAARLEKLDQVHGNTAKQQRLASVRTSLGLPEDQQVNELLDDIYSSHEGENWDEEFPTVAKTRIEGLRKVLRDSDRQAADVARKKFLPGRDGGLNFKGKPAKTGYKSAQEWADTLGDALGIPD